MTSLTTKVLLSTAFTFALGAPAWASEWKIDSSNTTTEFAVRHMMVNEVKGQFGKTTGTVSLDDKDATKSKVEVTIDTTTIDTREPTRDGHLKSPDFFDVAKYPTMSFKSTKIEKDGKSDNKTKGKLKMTGDLTMHGVTKPVVLSVEGPTPAVKNPMGQMIRGVSVSGKLNRKDWGLTWNKALEAGGLLVGDEVKVQINAELSEANAAPPPHAAATPPAPPSPAPVTAKK